jgi:hypothetical protein
MKNYHAHLRLCSDGPQGVTGTFPILAAVESWLHPCWPLNQLGVLHPYWPSNQLGVYSTTLVQYLYISCYLSDNEPVLSYLLSRLLPHCPLWLRTSPFPCYCVFIFLCSHSQHIIYTIACCIDSMYLIVSAGEIHFVYLSCIWHYKLEGRGSQINQSMQAVALTVSGLCVNGSGQAVANVQLSCLKKRYPTAARLCIV